MKVKKHLKMAILLIVAVSFVLLPSCGKMKSPLEPVETISVNDDVSADTQAKKPKKIRNESSWSASEVIDLEAAKKEYVELEVADAFKFIAFANSIIPPTQDMSRITLTIQATLDRSTFSQDALVFNFGPDGLQFAPPAELRIKAERFGRLLDRQKFSLHYYDDKQARWVKRETITTLWSNKSSDSEKEISVEIPHFSLWAISKD